MQDIVIESLNDLEFLKVALKTEIDEINIRLESLKGFKTVQKYIALTKIEGNIKGNDISNNKAKIKNAIDNLVTEFIEVKQYIESIKALDDFNEDLEELENLTAIDDGIYNKERKEKEYIPSKVVLKHLLNIKAREELPMETNIKEFNNYINSVRNTIQNYVHYDDDQVTDKILGFNIYENPHNYDINNVEKLPNITLTDLTTTESLSKREEEAFYGSEAYKSIGLTPQDKVKKKVL